MRLTRRTLIVLAVVIGVLIAGLVVALALIAGDDNGKKEGQPGRVAVIDEITGCGLVTVRPDGTDRRRLCLPGVWAGVSVSADGSTLAWDTVSGSRSGIVVADAKAENRRVVPLPAGFKFEPSLAPDGDSLAFLRSPRDDGRYDVWTVSTSGGNAKRLTTSRNVSTLAWSPAGDEIAYVAGWSPDTLEGDIDLIEPSGGGKRLLLRGDAPAWSPDAGRLAFARNGSVWTVNEDGTGLRLLARNGHAPAWSRDGRWLAFMRQTSCAGDVCQERAFVIPSVGGMSRPVGPTFGDSRRLLWIPD